MSKKTYDHLRDNFGADGIHLDSKNGWLFGVCAGLALKLRTDPAIVRVGVIIAGLFVPQITIAAYLIAWLVLDDRVTGKRRSEKV